MMSFTFWLSHFSTHTSSGGVNDLGKRSEHVSYRARYPVYPTVHFSTVSTVRSTLEKDYVINKGNSKAADSD